MIRPFRHWWKQFNGPQITAIMQAVFEFFRTSFDDTMEYFKHFSLATALNEHLTLIGEWCSFVRPIVHIPNGKYFMFTDGPSHNNDHGVSDGHHTADDFMGGVFTDLADEYAIENADIRIPAPQWRALLRRFLDSEGEIGSLVKLDDIIDETYKLYRSNSAGNDCHITIIEEPEANRTHGDVVIAIGSEHAWGDEYPIVQGIINSFGTTIYSPEPRLFIDTSEDGEGFFMEWNTSDDPMAQPGDIGAPFILEGAYDGEQLVNERYG